MLLARDAWLSTATDPDKVQHIFSFSNAGWTLYCETVRRQDPASILTIGAPDTSVGAWNNAYDISNGDILIQLSDDMLPPQDWDRTIRELIGDVSKPRVLGCSPDSPAGSQGGLLTLAIMTRAYAEMKGYFLYPEYRSVFSDDDLTQAAMMDDVLVDSYAGLRFRHEWGGHDGDATYRRQNSKHSWFVGRNVYEARKRGLFPAVDMQEVGVNDALEYGDAVWENEVQRQMIQSVRLFTGCAHLKNRLFELGSYRDRLLAHEWTAARDGAQALLEKYRTYNGGDMKLDGLRFALDVADAGLRS
jgi:hypothetical protein